MKEIQCSDNRYYSSQTIPDGETAALLCHSYVSMATVYSRSMGTIWA